MKTKISGRFLLLLPMPEVFIKDTEDEVIFNRVYSPVNDTLKRLSAYGKLKNFDVFYISPQLGVVKPDDKIAPPNFKPVPDLLLGHWPMSKQLEFNSWFVDKAQKTTAQFVIFNNDLHSLFIPKVMSLSGCVFQALTTTPQQCLSVIEHCLADGTFDKDKPDINQVPEIKTFSKFEKILLYHLGVHGTIPFNKLRHELKAQFNFPQTKLHVINSLTLDTDTEKRTDKQVLIRDFMYPGSVQIHPILYDTIARQLNTIFNSLGIDL